MSAISLLAYIALAIAVIGMLGIRDRFVRLVDLEHGEFHDEWLKDGRPVGGRASRKEASFWRSGFATQRCFNSWLVGSPTWAMNHRGARRLLVGMRSWSILLIVGIAALGAIAILGT